VSLSLIVTPLWDHFFPDEKKFHEKEKSFSLKRKKVFAYQKYSGWNGVVVPAVRRSAGMLATLVISPAGLLSNH
jgi:hypothetical protein